MKDYRMNIDSKSRGEMACRDLSEKAYEFYSNTDPISVYEYEGEFVVDGVFGKMEFDSFKEMEKCFEELNDELNSNME